jgi:hypothetical protein
MPPGRRARPGPRQRSADALNAAFPRKAPSPDVSQPGFLHLSSFVTVTLSDLIELHYPVAKSPLGSPCC